MAKYLVIVESPAKVKTIKKFLGNNYEVAASNGHVRDLPKSTLGIDVDGDYEPKYITIRGKGDVLAALRKEVKKADKIYLATDPDREGEAISWHLMEALKLQDKKVSRITFNEITQTAVKESLKNPREIDMDMVDAQQARRMLDRMVGYKISPLLWTKIKRGLSAGRVQSVALRIICDREEEIAAFIPEEYWTLDAQFEMSGSKKPVTASFYGSKGKKQELKGEEELKKVLSCIEGAEFTIADVKMSERTRSNPLPFTTSTLQQEASKVLNFSTQKTMRVAQQLYEGVDIGKGQMVGLITYLRTDSTRVSEEARIMAAEFIKANYGEEYLAGESKEKKNGQKIQDAHEAIRPTELKRRPEELKDVLSREQYRLYQLIWKRFAASQMANARFDTVTTKLECGDYEFHAAAQKEQFDGFLKVYKDSEEEDTNQNVSLFKVAKNDTLTPSELSPKQHFTQPPQHYTEASLVRAMEELGIGRPSTYSPTITTILARHYIVKENRNLYVSELGEAVNKMMKEAFPSIVDVNFTAMMEGLLDCVGEGTVSYKTVLQNFYPDLDAAVTEAEKELSEIRIADEESDVVCDLCGRKMVYKYGPHGKFLACPGFPECKNTKTVLEHIGVACPKCGEDIVVRKTRKGRRYYGCINNPTCDFMSWVKPVPGMTAEEAARVGE